MSARGTQNDAITTAKHRLIEAVRAFANVAANSELVALNIDRPIEETTWLAPHRYGGDKYDARWYAVMGAKDHFIEGIANSIDKDLDVLIAVLRITDEAKP